MMNGFRDHLDGISVDLEEDDTQDAINAVGIAADKVEYSTLEEM